MNRALAFVCMVAWAAAISIGLAGGPAWAEPRPDARADLSDRPLTLLPVVWSVIAEPVVAVKGTDELVHVAYELLFTNVTASAARIELIEAVDPSAEDASAFSFASAVKAAWRPSADTPPMEKLLT